MDAGAIPTPMLGSAEKFPCKADVAGPAKAGADATCGIGLCYKGRRRLLHAASPSATRGGDVCYERVDGCYHRRRLLLHWGCYKGRRRLLQGGDLLQVEADIATSGGDGCYIPDAVVLQGGRRRRR